MRSTGILQFVALCVCLAGMSTMLMANAESVHEPNNAISYDSMMRRLFRESMENRYVGSDVPVARQFSVLNVDDLGAEGDGILSKACMEYWMVQALRVTIFAGNAVPTNYCPFGPFGAAIVNVYDRNASNPHDEYGNNCGRLLETNSGIAEIRFHNPMMHGEINAILRLSDCNLHPEYCNSAGHFIYAQNKTWWNQLYLFTTAASCIADAGSEILAGPQKIIQGVTVRDLLENGWTQPSFIEPELFYASARQSDGVQQLIKGVKRDWLLQYYDWQYRNATKGCPEGCAVSTNPTTYASRCVSVGF